MDTAIVRIGASPVANVKTISAPAGYVCPSVISKANWVGSLQWPDEFVVTQNGTTLSVKRTDSSRGWGADIKIMCTGVCFLVLLKSIKTDLFWCCISQVLDVVAELNMCV